MKPNKSVFDSPSAYLEFKNTFSCVLILAVFHSVFHIVPLFRQIAAQGDIRSKTSFSLHNLHATQNPSGPQTLFYLSISLENETTVTHIPLENAD